MTIVRGLSVIRKENKDEKAYHRYLDIEDMGIVIYTPLDL